MNGKPYYIYVVYVGDQPMFVGMTRRWETIREDNIAKLRCGGHHNRFLQWAYNDRGWSLVGFDIVGYYYGFDKARAMKQVLQKEYRLKRYVYR